MLLHASLSEGMDAMRDRDGHAPSGSGSGAATARSVTPHERSEVWGHAPHIVLDTGVVRLGVRLGKVRQVLESYTRVHDSSP